ncbi:MAG: DUF1573 domain-containing protein [Crocinitomicaceae bacterium]|nr:DUF1573 domain-containing protein [Crocinitomicaceae bacterium]
MRLFDFAIIIALSSAFTLTGGAEFYFKETRAKFPDTNEGKILEHDYHFTNAGSSPLVISEYKVSCSCTSVQFPTHPIEPGESGKIHLRFDTEGKYGLQIRKIELYSNAPKNPTILSFKVNVIPREN